MQIEYDIEKDKWNQFVADNSSPASFLQSWQWGEFQKSLGLKIHRLGVAGESGELIAVAQAIVRPLHLGKTYLEITKGPVAKRLATGYLQLDLIIEELKRIGEKEKSIMIRINPPYEDLKLFANRYSLIAPAILLRQTEPNDTVLVDLTKSEDELLSSMHEKSRYNIRLAIKKGVRVAEKTTDRSAFDKFLELIEETAKRDGITVWPRERFEKFRQQFMIHNSPQPSLTLREGVPPLNLREGGGELLNSDQPRAILLTGSFEGKILAAAIVMLFGDSGTYLYAASSAEQRNANVPSLVLWEAIRRTKLAGKKYYDMWGIVPAGAGIEHSWAGITRFKTRYVKAWETGVEKHYTGTWDMVLDKTFYNVFKIGKILRGIIR